MQQTFNIQKLVSTFYSHLYAEVYTSYLNKIENVASRANDQL